MISILIILVVILISRRFITPNTPRFRALIHQLLQFKLAGLREWFELVSRVTRVDIPAPHAPLHRDERVAAPALEFLCGEVTPH